MHKRTQTIPDLPDDVVLSVRHVSKKFCRNLRRSMWYGMQDLGRNLLGLRPNGSGFFVEHNSEPTTNNQQPSPPLRRDEFWALRDISFDLRRCGVPAIVRRPRKRLRQGCGKA